MYTYSIHLLFPDCPFPINHLAVSATTTHCWQFKIVIVVNYRTKCTYLHLLLQNLALLVWKTRPKHVLKMFGLDQRQLLLDYWRNLKPKQTLAPVPPLPTLPMETHFRKWRQRKQGNIDKFMFSSHLKSRLTFI